MAFRDYSVGVNLIGRDVSASKALNQLGLKAKNTQQTLSNMARKATVVLAAMGAVAKVSIDAASNYVETTSKVGVIFGEQSAAIEKFAKTADTSFGLSQTAAMDAASTFATFGKSAGLSGTDLTGFSTKLVSLSSDLASFYNTSPEDAINAIGSALRGENEPIRRYGVLLNDASLKQEALAMGIIKTTKKALTPQQKVLAAQSLIFKSTGDAQGDFGRTSGGLANQQRILTAQMTNLRVEVGMALLPYMKELVSMFRKAIPWIREHKDLFAKLAPIIAGVAVAVIAMNAAFKVWKAMQMAVAIATLAAKWMGFTTAVETSSTALVASGVAVDVAWAPFLLTIAGILAAFVGINLAINKIKKHREQLLNDPNVIPSWSVESNKTFHGTEMRAAPHAKGGIVTKPHIGLVGEAGPEAIIPLSKFGMIGGVTVVNHIQGTVTTQKELSSVIRNDIAQLMRRKGLNPAIIGV
jgi:hypothetical protein